MKTRQLAGAMALVGAAVMLGACQTVRPIEEVMADGLAAYDEGAYARAEADFQEYVSRERDDAEGRFQLGRALLAQGDAAAASEHLWVAYDLEPQREAYLDTLAEALYQADRIDDLYRLLTQVAGDPGHVEGYLRLGEYARRLGDVDQAEPALITAVRIDGGESTGPLLALADFYRSIGDEAKEIHALGRAYHIDPENETITARLRELEVTPGPTLATEPAGTDL